MAITWTKEWSSADDGTVVSGADLKNIQDDVSSGVEGNATSIQDIPVEVPVVGDDESLLYYDHGNLKFDYVPRLDVLATPNAIVDIDGGTIDGVAISGLTLLGMTTVTDIDDILDEDAMGSDSDTALATQQSIKKYVDDNATTPYVVGTTEYLLVSADVENSDTDTSYVKTKEFILARGGELRIDYDVKESGGTGTIYTRVYQNGTPLGDEQQEVNPDAFTPVTQDVAGWSAGDLLQIYIKTDGGSTWYLKNAKLYATIPSVEAATLD